jgi:hypothetical protein
MKLESINRRKSVDQACTDTVVETGNNDKTQEWEPDYDSDGKLKPVRNIEAENERDWFITGDGDEGHDRDTVENRLKAHDETLTQHTILLGKLDTKLDNISIAVEKIAKR